ncbi:DNA polymerase III subunit delta' [Nitrogeniibacter mangrovi]|uniref:DNA polymerase III subunit delta n=1 Tax=Nitrogeniibacter mangrovi TaxID=2016596 RepID=A0A6C1B4L4_9RHOO|nr:DNA polymerase III subunit delta' [Nitrogeniibacter mangrovi]QID17949.1 DNA polymerase III subunit delta' [Nitrogeniibacter mangrovi]
MILPWQQRLWRQVVDGEARRAHALLLNGPPGQGKRAFAEAYAARVLCTSPDGEGFACGQCEGCRLRLSGNHPDLLRVVPEAHLPEAEQSGGKTKPSTQILVEQIRELREKLSVTTHQSGARVILVDPAEAMNLNTANALLKLLEEPPPGSLFLLVSSAPRRLLPTIRSRCQQWSFARPDAAQARAWLMDAAGPDADPLLALSGGMPVAAARLAAHQGAALRERFVRDIATVPGADPVMLAGDWDAWLRAKAAVEAGFELPVLIDWMLRWVWDLAATGLGAPARYFPDQDAARARLIAGVAGSQLLDCYNDVVQIHRVASHPLNARLVLEDMLLRYARALRPAQVRTSAGR